MSENQTTTEDVITVGGAALIGFEGGYDVGYHDATQYFTDHVIGLVFAAGGDVTVPPEFLSGLSDYGMLVEDAPNGGRRYRVVSGDELEALRAEVSGAGTE